MARMVQEAEQRGANAIVAMRFDNSQLADHLDRGLRLRHRRLRHPHPGRRTRRHRAVHLPHEVRRLRKSCPECKHARSVIACPLPRPPAQPRRRHPPAPAEPPSVPSRRELNKAATRQAITDAALALLRSNGPGNFTVEDIADAAGISRRTFFNYFGSTEAAIAAVTFGFLDKALQQFRLRPAGEPFMESARAALVELADPMTVAPLAELYSLGQANPQLSRSELEAWDHCTAQIIDRGPRAFPRGRRRRTRRTVPPRPGRLRHLLRQSRHGRLVRPVRRIPHPGIPVQPAPTPDRLHEPAGLRIRPPRHHSQQPPGHVPDLHRRPFPRSALTWPYCSTASASSLTATAGSSSPCGSQ